MSLARMQRLFQQAILGEDPGPLSRIVDPSSEGVRERIGIYRHHFLESLTAALAEVYPVTRLLVGEDYFRQLARSHIDAHPPRDPRLSEYGRDLALTIAQTASCADLPYLPDVARLEWAMCEVVNAFESAPLDLNSAAETLRRTGEGARVDFIPSYRLFRSDWPVDDIWRAHQRAELPSQLRIERQQAFAWVGCDEQGTYVRSLSVGEYVLRQRLAARATIADAALAAVAEEPALDLPGALAAVLTDRIIAAVRATC